MYNTNSDQRPRYYIAILLIILIHLFAFFHSDTQAKENTPEFIFNQQSEYWPTKGWKTSTPEEQGMNPGPLAEMFGIINNSNIDIYSILIVRNGYIVTEANINNPDATYPIYSSTKSFTSAVIGIALAKGYIKNIDQKIIDFFPEYSEGEGKSKKASITLRHLLTMSSGFEWPELDTDYFNPENPVYQMMYKNWAEFIFNKPVIHEPGSVFNYNSGCSFLLLAVLCRAGLDVGDFVQKNLFTPLGISQTEYHWDTTYIKLKDDSFKWIPNGSHGLNMNPRSMAKFGYLYLKGGFWEGRQIIPKTWIKESINEQIKITGKLKFIANDYGYQWYIQSFGFHSAGYKGQYIFIIPEHELVVVFTSNLTGPQIIIPVNLVKTNIIPAVQTSTPLPENVKATIKLKSEIKKFEKQ